MSLRNTHRRVVPLGALLAALAAFTVLLCPAVTARADARSSERAVPESVGGLTDEQRRELERIATLGYVDAGSQVAGSTGVLMNEPEAFEWYTAFVSRDQAGAFLIDMEGRTVHSWHEGDAKNWTRVWVCPDGGALGISTKPG